MPPPSTVHVVYGWPLGSLVHRPLCVFHKAYQTKQELSNKVNFFKVHQLFQTLVSNRYLQRKFSFKWIFNVNRFTKCYKTNVKIPNKTQKMGLLHFFLSFIFCRWINNESEYNSGLFELSLVKNGERCFLFSPANFSLETSHLVP